MANDILITPTGTGLKDFLSALVKPLQTNTDSLKTFETEYTKRAKFNGQKIVLQAALNDIFGITSDPFIIVETNQSLGRNTYSYEPSELSPIYISESSENDPVYFFEPSELVPLDYDFKVRIPSGIYTTELDRRIKAETNIFKIAGPRFITEIY